MPTFQEISDFIKRNGFPAVAAVFLGALLFWVMRKQDAAQEALAASEARTRAAMEKCVQSSEAAHEQTRIIIREEASQTRAVVVQGPDGGAR